ncbi:MAG: hypothetical protein RLZZ210_1274 [Pseudomonadota bacterium]|jgi:heme-binding NEAT domain protein
MDYQAWLNLMQEYAKSPKDIQEQIKSLKQIEQWLQMNITMVQNSIQYLNMCKDVSENSNMNNFFQQFNAMMQQNSNFDMQNVVMKASSDWIEQMKKIQEGWKNSNSKPE